MSFDDFEPPQLFDLVNDEDSLECLPTAASPTTDLAKSPRNQVDFGSQGDTSQHLSDGNEID